MLISSVPYQLTIYLSVVLVVACLECPDRCLNDGVCTSSWNGSMCACPDGYSGSRCESQSRYAPLLFLCDTAGSLIYESSADELDFNPLPLPNIRQPVAVGYDYEDDVIFWVDANDGSLNRVQRNGSDYSVLNVSHAIGDLAIHVPSKKMAWISALRDLAGLYDYSDDIQGMSFSGSNFSTLAVHPYGDFYLIDNVSPNPEIHVRNNNFQHVTTFVNTELTATQSLALDRQGTRLFFLDDQKKTIESCGPRGETHRILMTITNTNSVLKDVEWYRGTPLWTESVTTKGVSVLNGQRHVSPASTNSIRFSSPAGIHIYHGQSYVKLECLPDELSCDNICIPTGWACDGLIDCADGSDEANCNPSEDSGALLIVTSLGESVIYMSHTNDLNFQELPLLSIEIPVAVDYDVIAKEVYWTDVGSKTLSAARIDGTNQRTLVQGLGVPDGLFVDSASKTVFWSDVQLETIETIQFDGTGRQILIGTGLDRPRALIIVPSNRKLYWTDWGTTPMIERSNSDGSDRQVIVQTNLGWPNGLTYDGQGDRLIWCDALLDKIESSDTLGQDRRLLLDVTHGVLHPFDMIMYQGTLMWTDWTFHGVGVQEGDQQNWPRVYANILSIAKPGGFHVVVNSCLDDPCDYGTCHALDETNYWCECMDGFTGKNCSTEITCVLPQVPEGSHAIDPMVQYSPGELLEIVCDNDEDVFTYWRCNSTTGEWDILKDLDCTAASEPGPQSNLMITVIGPIVSAVVVFVLMLLAFFIYKYKQRKTSLPQRANINLQQTPCAQLTPADNANNEINDDDRYYTRL